MFNIAISYLTTSNLSWFTDLTYQISLQYYSLQHQTLLSPLDTSTAECHFCFGPAASFFLGLLVIALSSSPVAYWTPFILWSTSSGVVSFYLFVLSMGFSRQEHWNRLPLSSPVDHILSEHFTMTCPSWVALHGVAHSFIDLYKPLHNDKAVIQEGVITLTSN